MAGESESWGLLTDFRIAYVRITYPGIAHTGLVSVAAAFTNATADELW